METAVQATPNWKSSLELVGYLCPAVLYRYDQTLRDKEFERKGAVVGIQSTKLPTNLLRNQPINWAQNHSNQMKSNISINQSIVCWSQQCWDDLLRSAVEMICWDQLSRSLVEIFWSTVEIICLDQLLKICVATNCWDYLVRSAAEVMCCDQLLGYLLSLSVKIRRWDSLLNCWDYLYRWWPVCENNKKKQCE